jgi:adenosylcobinamide kinase / adenosylcobinamide-phosphate guanylyltransferase
LSLLLLLGGARSGKSALAVELARQSDHEVVFVATAEAGDDEMRARIARHQGERPEHWKTVEAPIDLSRALELAGPDRCLVLDCLTLWVANLLDARQSEPAIERLANDVAVRAEARPGLTIAVTNEVGLGVVPATPLGRHYRDLLGRVNARWAELADQALFVVAGRALPLARTAELLAESLVGEEDRDYER